MPYRGHQPSLEDVMIRICLAVAACLGCCCVAWAQTPTPLHAYELNGSLTDTFAGPALVNNGASLGATGLTFGANQGPSLSSWLGGSATSGNYSIEMYFSLDTTNGFRKLIDFSNRVSDTGLYNISTALQLYNLPAGTSGAFADGVMTHLVLTRDGASNQIVGYINGSTTLGISQTDGGNIAVFAAANNIISFFQDDAATGFSEASGGFVDFIRIYDHPVTAEDAQNLFGAINAVPEPATWLMMAAGVSGTGMVMYKKLKQKRRQRRNKAVTLPVAAR